MFPVNRRQIKVKNHPPALASERRACSLSGNVYITYFSEIKCRACQAVMRGNEKQQVAFDARGRQEPPPNTAEKNGSADKMSLSAYFINGFPSR